MEVQQLQPERHQAEGINVKLLLTNLVASQVVKVDLQVVIAHMNVSNHPIEEAMEVENAWNLETDQNQARIVQARIVQAPATDHILVGRNPYTRRDVDPNLADLDPVILVHAAQNGAHTTWRGIVDTDKRIASLLIQEYVESGRKDNAAVQKNAIFSMGILRNNAHKQM
jgi:hypothetical protein